MPPDTVDRFIEHVEDNDLSQDLVVYPETHYIGKERGFPIGLWRLTNNNGVEDFHNTLQKCNLQMLSQIYGNLSMP